MRCEPQTVVLDCFLKATSTERNNCEGILRSTLHQLLTQVPGLLLQLPSSSDRGSDWTYEKVRLSWPQLMVGALRKGCGIVIVLDGFDEILDQEQYEFLDRLRQCEDRWKPRHELLQRLQIVVLSRPCRSLDQQVEQGEFTKYRIKRDDTNDIHHTVEQTLSEFPWKYSKEFGRTVAKTISRAARGIYLWATIMLEYILWRMPSTQQLQNELKGLPEGLERLYHNILTDIRGQGRFYEAKTRLVLLWIVHCTEPLRLEELHECCKDGVTGLSNEFLLEQQRKIPPPLFRTWLAMVCGPLLRFSAGNHVEPVHRSLVKFLTKEPQSSVMENQNRFYMVATEIARPAGTPVRLVPADGFVLLFGRSVHA